MDKCWCGSRMKDRPHNCIGTKGRVEALLEALKLIESGTHDNECMSDQGSRDGDCMSDHRCYCASRIARKALS